jgi:predicted nucleotidyltransferase
MATSETLRRLRTLADRVVAESVREYSGRLVSVAVFGSVARGTPSPESDLDLLLVVEPLPRGRLARLAEFERIEDLLSGDPAACRADGTLTLLSPVLKTSEEVRRGSPLFLDMTIDVDIRFDRDGFLRSYLDGLRDRMARLGSRRVPCKGGYYWILKPDYRPGEVIEL